MAEHQVMSRGNIHNIKVISCYFSHNSYSRDLVSHPNDQVQRAAHSATKPIGYEKPLRVQRMLGKFRRNQALPIVISFLLVE